jgi:hypothetical protein
MAGKAVKQQSSMLKLRASPWFDYKNVGSPPPLSPLLYRAFACETHVICMLDRHVAQNPAYPGFITLQ